MGFSSEELQLKPLYLANVVLQWTKGNLVQSWRCKFKSS